MGSTEVLVHNLRIKYGNLSKASNEIEISCHILHNWSAGRSNPHLGHLETISKKSKINSSFWIHEDFLKVHVHAKFTQNESLSSYFQRNLEKYMVLYKKRRRDLFYDYHSDFVDIISPDTFDDYRFGRIKNIPLYRLDQLGSFFKCPSYKLIEVN